MSGPLSACLLVTTPLFQQDTFVIYTVNKKTYLRFFDLWRHVASTTVTTVHPSCSLTFEMHILNRPLTSSAAALPLSAGVPPRGGRDRRVAGVSRLSCQHRFHVLSGACEESGRNAQTLQDSAWGHSTSDLLLLSPWTPCSFYSITSSPPSVSPGALPFCVHVTLLLSASSDPSIQLLFHSGSCGDVNTIVPLFVLAI